MGACFGKDVILSNDNLRDIGDAIALTFVQTISLTQKDIFELCSATAFNRFDHKRFGSDALLLGVSKCFKNIGILNKIPSFFLHSKISHYQAFLCSIKAATRTSP